MKALFVTLLCVITNLSAHTVFLFAHGLWRNKKQVKEFVHNYERDAFQVDQYNWDIAPGPYYTFDFPDAVKKGKLNSNKVNVGQSDDINRLHDACEKIRNYERTRSDDVSIVIIGCSRGAMTAISAAGSRDLPNVKAIVAEAPGDCVYSVLNHWLAFYRINWPWLVSAAYYLLYSYIYPIHKKEGIHPCNAAHTIPQSLPIFLVHSKNDNITPINSSRLLYITLRLKGNNNSYLLELDDAIHGRYYTSLESQKYQEAVHAFYERYNIPCNYQYAQAGRHLLHSCQPSIQKVLERIFIEQFAYTLKLPFAPSVRDDTRVTVRTLLDLMKHTLKDYALPPAIVDKIIRGN